MPPKSPLPQRYGLDAAWVRSDNAVRKAAPPFATMRDWLFARLNRHFDVDLAIAEGRFVFGDGSAVSAHDKYRPQTFVWFHRPLREEAPVPGKIKMLYRDERIIVVDKPPFLSSIPRGRHVMQSAVVRLRHELGLPELAPMHRLDRVTAGLLLFTTERRWRGAYQTLFQNGGVQKSYLAIAPYAAGFNSPVTVRTHLQKMRGVRQVQQVPCLEANSATIVELLRELPAGAAPAQYPPLSAAPGTENAAGAAPLAIYRLTPLTGKTNQLRVHLANLGIPIVGDPLYPVERNIDIDDFRVPLQLLAHKLSFTDPIDGCARAFCSARNLPVRASD